MYKQLKTIFEKLQDEQSRDIFMYKLRCALDNSSKPFDYLVPPGRGGLKTYTLNFLKMMMSLYGYSNKTQNSSPMPLFKFLLEYTDHKEIVIYGSGNMGQETYHGLLDWGISVACFCDSDKNKHGTECCGIPVISPEALVNKHSNSIVILSVWSEKAMPIIVKYLLENGFKSAQLVSTFDISDPYFCHPVFPPVDYETYLDVGCLDGNSIADYIKFCSGRYKKIFGLEPDTINFMATTSLVSEKKFNNVELIPKGAWSTSAELHFTNAGNGSSRITENGDIIVPVTKIDDILTGIDAENILIKLDIEGAELEALKGAVNTIRYKKPRLAISLYHKPEDIIEIPEFLNELAPEYKFFIRHCNLYNLTETILFAAINGGGGVIF